MGAVDRQVLARGRQVLAMATWLPKVDALIEEAAAAKVAAPGLLEMREWMLYCAAENAVSAEAGAGDAA